MKPQATIYSEIRNPVIKQYVIQIVFGKMRYVGTPDSMQQYRLVIEIEKIYPTTILLAIARHRVAQCSVCAK